MAPYIGWLTVACIPSLITVSMVSHYFGTTSACALPGFNDEVSHWHQVKTFSEVGLRGGYYTVNEKTATLAFAHFGNWGMGFPIVMGSLAKLFGWYANSAMYYNIAFITTALAALLLVCRPDAYQTAVLIAFSATFWPLLLYVPRTMQTTLHISFSVLFAALFYARGAYPNRRRYVNTSFLVVLAMAATVQFTWLLVLFPWLLQTGRTIRQILIRIAAGTAVCLAGAIYFRLTVPPYPEDSAAELLQAVKTGASQVVNVLGRRFMHIAALRGDTFEGILWVQCAVLLALILFECRAWIRSWFVDALGVSSRLLAPLLLATVSAALLLLCSGFELRRARYFLPPAAVLLYPTALRLIAKIRVRLSEPRDPVAPVGFDLLAAVLLVFLPFATMILVGFPDGHRGYRLVAPFMSTACLLLILRRRYRVALAIAAVALVGTPDFFVYYALGLQGWHSCPVVAEVRDFDSRIRPYIQYDPTEEPWCNTLLFELNAFQPPLIAVPAGIGLSFIYGVPNLQTPLHSKYVLANSEVQQGLEARGVHLQPLTNTHLGALYRNPAANCVHSPPTPLPATSIWATASVPSIGWHNDSPVTLGMKFRSDVTGTIAGIRFYKGPGNNGTHTGLLYSATGTLLAQATFSGETASGWQQVTFPTPVAISANTIYIAAYHSTSGFAYDAGYFGSSGVDSAPLHGLSYGVDGPNGVYMYGATPRFPSFDGGGANYWADVVFAGGGEQGAIPPAGKQPR